MQTTILTAAASLFLIAGAAQAGTILNGGFETLGGSLTSWTVTSSGDSAWYVQSGAAAPVNAFTVPLPPQGTYAAMADGGAPGATALAQSFTVPVNVTDVMLSFDYCVLNPASASGTYTIPLPDSLDWTGDPNQQARVDLFTQAAAPFDVTPVSSGGGLLANIFQTQPGDSNGTGDSPEYSVISTDITADIAPGGTYQLRFAEADNLGPLVFGIDNVRLAFLTSDGHSSAPEPGTLLLLAGGLLAAAICARSRSSTRKAT